MGLPLACVFAANGASVTVCDINPSVVDSINRGESPYEEPGLADLIREMAGSARLTATRDTAASVSGADVVVVIVPAHLTPDMEIDYGVLLSASEEIGRGLRRGTLVVYETTVSVGGTRRKLIPALEASSGLRAGPDFLVAYSPERVKANLVLKRLQTTPKVLGAVDESSLGRAVQIYAEYLRAPIDVVGTLEAAEMTKLLGMLYRDVNIALANELAAYCENAGVDFDRVRQAANRDGEASILEPGIGVGGHCTPVYPYFLTRESRRIGVTQRLAEAAREINDWQPSRQVDRLKAGWRDLRGLRVHILGLGFRPGVKVDTYSPAYILRDHLKKAESLVTLEDPYYSSEEIKRAGFAPDGVHGAHVVILNTAHPEFSSPDFHSWHASGVGAVLDGRNLWQQDSVEEAGLVYFGIGRSSATERARNG